MLCLVQMSQCSYTTFVLLSQSLDYDRIINEPHVEVLEGMDNKVKQAKSVFCSVVDKIITEYADRI